MGYSCTATAAYTLDALNRELDRRDPTRGSNGMPAGGFYERGREHDDGAITGTVWRKLNAAEKARYSHLDQLDTRMTRKGSYRIEADGRVARFPGIDRATLRAAETAGAAIYQENHGPVAATDWPSWRDERDAAIRCLDCNPPPPLDLLWDGVQHAAQGYQRENGVAFLVMPKLEETALRAFLVELGD